MEKKNCKRGKGMKREVEKMVMVMNVKWEMIDIVEIRNGGFM